MAQGPGFDRGGRAAIYAEADWGPPIARHACLIGGILVFWGSCFANSQPPINYLQNPSFELDDGSWELGPDTELKRHRGITGVRVATLDGKTESYILQTVVVERTGEYQLSALISTGRPHAQMGFRVNDQPMILLELPYRFEWVRRGFDGVALKKGDRLEVYFRGGEDFLNVEDVALYLQSQTPYDLANPEPYRFVLADVSRLLPIFAMLVIGSCVGMYGTWWAWRWKDNLGGGFFIRLSISGALTALGYLWELLDGSYVGSRFGYNVKLASLAFFTGYFLLFSLWYVGSRWLSKSLTKLIFSLAGLFTLLLFTNDQHQLMLIQPYLSWGASYKPLTNQAHGFMFSFGQFLIILVQILAIGSMWVLSTTTSTQYRVAMAWFSSGFVMSQAFMYLGSWRNSNNWIEWKEIDTSILGFTIALVVYVFTVVRFRMLEYSPTAWGQGQVDVSDPMIVTTPGYELVELNSQARALLGRPVLRQSLMNTIPGLPLGGGVFQYLERSYRVSSDSIEDAGHVIGHRFLLHDITEIEQREQALRTANAKLEVLQHQLREQATRDSLTGLYNRRFLDEWLGEKGQQEHGLILLDVDYFREFNARFGYAGGDHVLRAIGEYLNTLPSGQFACRYGGEEFCVVLPGLTLEATEQVGESLRRGIADLRPIYQGKPLSVTVSLGVAWSGLEAGSPLASADRALQSAKRKGRNRSERSHAALSRWGRGWG